MKYKKWENITIKQKIIGIVILFIIVSMIFSALTAKKSNVKKATPLPTSTSLPKQASPTPTKTSKQDYPSLMEEIMDKDFTFSCEGGTTVALWDKPTDIEDGTKLRDRIACDTAGWAFNKYYNDKLKVTFYAVQTNDKRVKNTYGWITEDFLIWK